MPFAALKGNQYAEALKLTDFTLNEAKKLGRNRCYIFNGETYRKFLRKREITQELREAVINGFQGFTAFYQPVFAEDKKVPYGAEALMRFTSEKFGMISPAEFIPILEGTEAKGNQSGAGRLWNRILELPLSQRAETRDH